MRLFSANNSTSVYTPDDDIKKISKRKFQFGVLISFNCLVMLFMDLYWHNYITVYMLGAMLVMMGIMLYLNRLSKTDLRGVAIIILGVLLLGLCLVEGLNSGCYSYYIAMLVAIPQVLKNNKEYNKYILFYMGVTALLFLSSIFFSSNCGWWQHMASNVCRIKFAINCILTLELTLMFTYFTVYYEKRYARALTEQKDRAEEAMKARIRFLSNMGHELRTPLNGIIGSNQLLRDEPMLPEQEEYISIINYCSKHMLELVNNILDFNKIEAGKVELHKEKINIGKLLSRSTGPFHNQFQTKCVKILSEIDPRLHTMVYADDMRLVQVLNNLISNALKFTDYGHVKLKAELIEENNTALHIKVAVEDTGIGLDEEACVKVFERFWQQYNESTRKYSGTGLGLSICNMLLEMMNSKLELKSTKGVGSIFYFNLWVEKSVEAVTTHPVQNLDLPSIEDANILVAEDNQINMTIITKTLKKWNCNVTGCCNGVQTLKQLKEYSDYDLILLDLEMPEMDGFTAIKEIKKLYPHIPVLAFSAVLMDTEMYNNLIGMGFADCVLKPFKSAELYEKIAQYAGKQNYKPELVLVNR